MFTCEVCKTKSVRSISKQAYHQGVVLVRCEGCDKIHLMADNLGWFEDKPVNVEELMRRKNKPMLKITNNVEIANILSKFLQKRESEGEKKEN
jgi:mitochondrial protein import protein ZIM17